MDSVQVEGVHNIRTTVFNHFSSHFRSLGVERPEVEDLEFQKLSSGDSSFLVRPFSLDEVKQAVWDCDSCKSPGPDGIIFGFIKEFLQELKDDLMRFFTEFH